MCYENEEFYNIKTGVNRGKYRYVIGYYRKREPGIASKMILIARNAKEAKSIFNKKTNNQYTIEYAYTPKRFRW